ncbi:MAG: Gfo/Idh/MocA family oxidoreductase [Spirochaetales bacterium]|nr:Gfo/Idh/MocA family oxidoreductase [Spirochaetales bacterium]
MKRLRVGVIGAGNVATTAHLPAYAKLDCVDLVAVCDSSRDRVQAAARNFGVPHAYTSWDELIRAGGLDAVSVCVGNKLHAPATLAALEAGIHVLCEKPPALTAQEARTMEEAAERNGVILAYGFHWRFTPEAEYAKAAALRGELGRVYSGRVQALRRRGIPGWGGFTDKAASGGGALMDIGVHMLDLAMHILGWPEPASVSAASYAELGTRAGPGLMGSWDPGRFSVEDSLFGFIRFADGSSLSVDTAYALNMGPKSVMNVELYGSQAGLSLYPLRVYGESGGQLSDLCLPFPGEPRGHAECVEDFARAALSWSPARSTAREGTALMELVDLLYRSAELGQPVEPGRP